MTTEEMRDRFNEVTDRLIEAGIHARYLTVHDTGSVGITLAHADFDEASHMFHVVEIHVRNDPDTGKPLYVSGNGVGNVQLIGSGPIVATA
jgi:hypothetical protein